MTEHSPLRETARASAAGPKSLDNFYMVRDPPSTGVRVTCEVGGNLPPKCSNLVTYTRNRVTERASSRESGNQMERWAGQIFPPPPGQEEGEMPPMGTFREQLSANPSAAPWDIQGCMT